MRACAIVLGAVLVILSACGDDGSPPGDAGIDAPATVDSGTDAGPDTDAGPEPDAGSGCTVAPRDGCCFADTDCPAGMQCHEVFDCRPGGEGRCMAPAGDSMCWSDRDCPGGVGGCTDVFLCACGMMCPTPDTAGSCTP